MSIRTAKRSLRTKTHEDAMLLKLALYRYRMSTDTKFTTRELSAIRRMEYDAQVIMEGYERESWEVSE